jgi:hypothetical protein
MMMANPSSHLMLLLLVALAAPALHTEVRTGPGGGVTPWARAN